jgi:hypothetical protein
MCSECHASTGIGTISHITTCLYAKSTAQGTETIEYFNVLP